MIKRLRLAWVDTLRTAGNDSPSRTRGFWNATDKIHVRFLTDSGGARSVRVCVFGLALALDFVCRVAEEARLSAQRAIGRPYVRWNFNDSYLQRKA